MQTKTERKSVSGVNLALMEQSRLSPLLNIPLTFQFAGIDTKTQERESGRFKGAK